MARVILSLVLTVEALLGPSLCCCSFSHFAPVATKKTFAEEGQTSKAPSPYCCCVKDNQPCDSSKRDNSSPRNSCPCREGHSKDPAVALSSTASVDVSQRFLVNSLHDFHWPFASDSRVPASLTAKRERTFTPFLSARDLIDVHHLMRC